MKVSFQYVKKFCWTGKYIRLGEGEESILIVPKSRTVLCLVVLRQALQKSVFEYCGGNLVGIHLNMEDRGFIT